MISEKKDVKLKLPFVTDATIDNAIEVALLEDNNEKDAKHKRSGKLSASRLGDPLQWQILYALGVPQKELEPYVVRKFLRGTQVEDWVMNYLNPFATQDFCEYRGVVGYADSLVDTKNWENNYGIIPVEVKSVSSAKFKRVSEQGIDHSHKLQAGLYGKAKGTDHFAVCYISTDDYRVLTIIEETKKVQKEIDEVITKYEDARSRGIIPKFEAVEKWQENLEYCKYPDWLGLSEEEATAKYLAYAKQIQGQML